MKTVIDVAKDFSPYPAGRYVDDGPYSGEAFREQNLVPALREGEKVIIQLDGSEGYGSSFLEEAFGGLVRGGYFSAQELNELLSIVSDDIALIDEIRAYINSANQKANH
ncbi:MAG: STAS-like domain-containing protein [Rhodospirillaceae bacterium]|nr:STAS-like domain-containing protein [Rhodospirillaceae bacterium]